jgi:hypothetical protein
LQRLSDQRRSLALAGLAASAVIGGAVFRRRRRAVRDELLAPVPTVERPLDRAEDSGPPPAVAVPPPASEPEAAEPLPEAVDTADVPEAAINAEPGASAGSGATETSAAGAEPTGAAADADSGSASDVADGKPAEKQTTLSEPTTGELSAEEASILAVLAQSGRTDDDRTAIAVATSLERETTDVSVVLRKLGNEGVVSGELYTATGDKIWAVTERGVRRLGAQH